MPPRKKKAAKKPVIDESSESDSFHESDEEPVKKRGRKPKIKEEKNDEDNEPKVKEENNEIATPSEEIKEGSNDLMHLPIEVIQEELIRRGYYPKLIKRFEKNILVSILREESSQVHETKRNRGDLVTKKSATMRNSHKNKPIFDANNNGEKEENVVSDEENDEDDSEQELPDVKPTEFK